MPNKKTINYSLETNWRSKHSSSERYVNFMLS